MVTRQDLDKHAHYELLQEYAQEKDKSIGAILRETIEQALILDLE